MHAWRTHETRVSRAVVRHNPPTWQANKEALLASKTHEIWLKTHLLQQQARVRSDCGLLGVDLDLLLRHGRRSARVLLLHHAHHPPQGA